MAVGDTVLITDKFSSFTWISKKIPCAYQINSTL